MHACMHTNYSGFVKAARQDRQKGRGKGYYSLVQYFTSFYTILVYLLLPIGVLVKPITIII
jgi:hypothetical protein